MATQTTSRLLHRQTKTPLMKRKDKRTTKNTMKQKRRRKRHTRGPRTELERDFVASMLTTIAPCCYLLAQHGLVKSVKSLNRGSYHYKYCNAYIVSNHRSLHLGAASMQPASSCSTWPPSRGQTTKVQAQSWTAVPLHCSTVSHPPPEQCWVAKIHILLLLIKHKHKIGQLKCISIERNKNKKVKVYKLYFHQNQISLCEWTECGR